MTDDFSDLATSNPSNRCPVVLLLDNSESMLEENRLKELAKGLSMFIDSVNEDPVARRSVELSIKTYYDNTVRTLCDFTEIAKLDGAGINLQAHGNTPMGMAIRDGLSAISKRRAYYKDNNIQSYAPFLIVMTDGGPNDDEWEEQGRIASRMSDQGKLVYIGIGVGAGADMSKLSKAVAGKHKPVQLNSTNFREFFSWLSDSLRTVTVKHSPGEDIGSKISTADI